MSHLNPLLASVAALSLMALTLAPGYTSPWDSDYVQNSGKDNSGMDRADLKKESKARHIKDDGYMLPTSATVSPARVTRGDVDSAMRTWSSQSKASAKEIMDKYGLPDEVTPTMFHWYNNGPWHMTTVYGTAVPHSFPVPHMDALETVIPFQVPIDKISDLAAYDGSIFVKRTDGLMAAKCHMEDMNFLALNLAKDIVSNTLTVDEARARYAELAKAHMSGQRPVETQRLLFPVLEVSQTRDADLPFMMSPTSRTVLRFEDRHMNSEMPAY